MSATNLKAPAADYIRSLTVRNLAESTITAATWKLNKFFDYLKSCGIEHTDHITVQVVRHYQIHLYQSINAKGRPNTAAYQNGLLSTAKQFLTFCKENDYIVTDPGRHVAYAKQPQRLPRGVLTPAEAKKILHAPDTHTVLGYRDRTILEVLYSSGIRKTELNNLTLADVDYHDGFLRIIEGKGRKDRIVPIGRIACRYLENYIKSVRLELVIDPCNQYLFLTMTGKRFSKNALWELIKKYAKKAKIKKNVYPHTFRHSCATSMLRNRADIVTIQKLLGHASLDSTQLYTYLSVMDLKDVHKRCHPREKDSR
jgi:integrase/recombinase XerD